MTTFGGDKAGREQETVQRLDRWLWFSRVLKSRTLAAQLISDGKVRVNRTRALKASQSVRAGDVLTIALRGKVQVLRVLDIGHRRGPAEEAKRLYEIVGPVSPGPEVHAEAVARRDPGAGRPSKRDRRMIDRLADDK